MTTHRIIIVLSICFLATMTFAPALAQTANDIANLQEQIARNQELLMRAKELVSETNSTKARTSLQMAADLHAQSKLLLQSGAGDGNLTRAAHLAQRAREAILNTIALARREARLEANATKTIDRAARRLEQAQQLMAENDASSAPARELTAEARGQLERSRDNIREHRYEVALRLAVSSEQLSSRAIAVMKHDVTGPDMVERELDRSDRVIERLGDEMGPGIAPSIQRMYQDARDSQMKAHEQYRNGQLRAAVEMTERARDTAMRALKMLASRVNQDNVERALGLTDALLQEATSVAVERDAPRLQKKIEQARDIQRTAHEQYSNGNYENALRATLRARNVVKDALGAVKQTLNQGDVNAALVETDDVLARLNDALAGSENELATQLYTRALANQEKAWNALRQDQLRAAIANTKLARRLARRATRQLNDEEL